MKEEPLVQTAGQLAAPSRQREAMTTVSMERGPNLAIIQQRPAKDKPVTSTRVTCVTPGTFAM